MSLLGAAAVGAGLGMAAENLIFNYSKSQYEEKISELEGFIAQLKDHMASLKDLRGRVFDFWDDDKARETCRVLDETISKVDREMENAELLCQNYRATVDSMGSAQGLLTSTIEDALGILGGVDL